MQNPEIKDILEEYNKLSSFIKSEKQIKELYALGNELIKFANSRHSKHARETLYWRIAHVRTEIEAKRKTPEEAMKKLREEQYKNQQTIKRKPISKSAQQQSLDIFTTAKKKPKLTRTKRGITYR